MNDEIKKLRDALTYIGVHGFSKQYDESSYIMYSGDAYPVSHAECSINIVEHRLQKLTEAALLHKYISRCKEVPYLSEMWNNLQTMAEIHGIPRPDID